MESVNYTYEEIIGYDDDIGDYTEYEIYNKLGVAIATAVNEENAELIVAALNGVAP